MLDSLKIFRLGFLSTVIGFDEGCVITMEVKMVFAKPASIPLFRALPQSAGRHR